LAGIAGMQMNYRTTPDSSLLAAGVDVAGQEFDIDGNALVSGSAPIGISANSTLSYGVVVDEPAAANVSANDTTGGVTGLLPLNRILDGEGSGTMPKGNVVPASGGTLVLDYPTQDETIVGATTNNLPGTNTQASVATVQKLVSYGPSATPLIGTYDPTGSPPPTPTLAITDNGDGTGATYAITGSDGTSTNNVYALLSGASSWVLVGTETGDGSGTAAVSNGAYWWYMISQTGGGQVATAPFLALTSSSQPTSVKMGIGNILRTDLVITSQLDVYDFGIGDQPAIFGQATAPKDASNLQKPLITLRQLPGTPTGEDRSHRASLVTVEVSIWGKHGASDLSLDSLSMDVWETMNRATISVTGYEPAYVTAETPVELSDQDGFPGYKLLCSAFLYEVLDESS